MKKYFCLFLTALILVCAFPIMAATELSAQSPYDIDLENIGIGGGGQITWLLIDPIDPDTYYCACDMGGLYNSTNKGASWDRITTEGYVNAICADEEGALFFGGYGLYKSSDKGRSSERIYPKNVHYTIKRCGWNELLMRAEDYDMGYVLCVATYGDTVYFATSDYLGNIRYLCCHKDGSNVELMGTGYLNASPTNMKFRIVADHSGVYFSDGYTIRCFDRDSYAVTAVFSAEGFIRDFAKIENRYFILDDTSESTKVLYTEDFADYSDLMDYNTLPSRFYVYGYPRDFEWRFQQIAGNNFNSIYLAFCDMNVINADGILKFNGSSFEWVFDGMVNNRAAVGADGWSFGSVRPVYDICSDPHDDNHMLLSVETVYDVYYESPDTRIVKTAHCIDYDDGSYGTKGLDVLATYAVKEDPFDSDHIILNCADVGVQNSFNAGKSFVRATIQGEDYARYNSCYDLYFDTHTQGKIYGLWSSIHEVPTHTDRIDKKYATGYLAVSYDGGYTWDFEYSDLPENSIPFKMSVEERDGELVIALATFNNGFFISYDSGRHFESISGDMEPITTSISGYAQDTADYIFGVDVKLAGDKVYCLAHHHSSGSGIIPAKLYEYDLSTKETKKIDLGEDIVIAKSLAYSPEKGLFVNVVPYYESRWLLDLNNFFWFNYGGGIYKVEDYKVRRVFEHENGIFNSGFAPDGKMYAVAVHGEVFVEEDGVFKPYVTGLFNQLMNVCFSSDGKKMYVTTSGGGTYRMNALHTHSFEEAWTTDVEPTCTTLGSKSRHCTGCDERTDQQEIPLLPHAFSQWTEKTPATCTAEGEEYRLCDTCKIRETRAIPKTEHTLSDWMVISPATCTQTGTEGRVCRNCRYGETRELPITAHSYGSEFTVDTPATCTSEGSKSRHCTMCGNRTDVTTIAKISHKDGNGDGFCDACNESMGTTPPATACDHICHKDGFLGFIYKLVRIFWKLFGINQYCKCGVAHY